MVGNVNLAWIDSVSAPVFVLDLDQWNVLRANDALHRMLPKDSPEAPVPLAAFLGTEAADFVMTAALRLRAGGSRNIIRVTCTVAGGPMDLVLHIKSLAGNPSLYTVTVDERIFVFDSVMPDDGNATFRDIVQALPIGIEIIDAMSRCIFYNQFSDSLFRYKTYSYVGMMAWFDRVFPDPAMRAQAIRQWDEAMAAADKNPGQEQAFEWTVLCEDGITRSLEERVTKIGSYYTFVFWDVTEQRRLEAKLRTLASTDTLTGLHSRRHFFDEATAMFMAARREAINFCLFIIDVDHFKAVNDRFGHHVGDQALIAVAGLCRAALRPSDILARFGGEEFVVLLPETARDDAMVIAHRLLQAVSAQPVATSAGSLTLTVSIGLACAGAATTIDQVIQEADAALYAAKRAGRNRLVVSGDLPVA